MRSSGFAVRRTPPSRNTAPRRQRRRNVSDIDGGGFAYWKNVDSFMRCSPSCGLPSFRSRREHTRPYGRPPLRRCCFVIRYRLTSGAGTV
jgi:hypothetical protein